MEESEEFQRRLSEMDCADGIVDPGGDMLPVVGLGGSQGSLVALQTFFDALPEATGMAYVVVVHLSPEHDSILAKILQRGTTMPVKQVLEPEKLMADHVYVIPPGRHLAMQAGILQTTEFDGTRGSNVAVDLFFRSLAESHGASATAVVLSGGDGDGASGLKRVKERGGLTIAQDPTEAEAEGMPRSAIATGMVDWVLPVAEMPRRLLDYRENRRRIQLPPANTAELSESKLVQQDQDEQSLRDVLAYLKARSGHDFSYYKRATILRRIGRRMQVNGTTTLAGYLDYLRTHPGESGALLQDLLISVTNFFRDKDAFAALETIVPQLFHRKTDADQLRVWVPACATGEEAYSIAILLIEHASRMLNPPRIQVFATDLDNAAVETAREGRYPEAILADVSEERLRTFFTKEPGCYRVRRSVRESVLFALHDLLKDSPFSRLDLISCRNLLIYLRREAQNRVFDIFHFALLPGGRLFLGSSESAEDEAPLFRQDDKKHRLYTRLTAPRVGLSVPAGASTLTFAYHRSAKLPKSLLSQEMRRQPADAGERQEVAAGRIGWAETHFKLLERLAPPSLLVNREYEVMHLSESAGKYLRMSGGEPSMNLLQIIRPELRTELRAALFLAAKSRTSVRLPDLAVNIDGKVLTVEVVVDFLDDPGPDFLLLVVFHDKQNVDPAPVRVSHVDKDSPEGGLVRHLEEELDLMRSNWRDTVEQYEASTEELKASNEELQAMNEELRSATEELETGREELQSINEEIVTINQELKSKVEELSRANSDLQNLMASTKIATIFLDRKLRIARFTPSTSALFNCISTDIGRPLSDLTHRLEYPEITADAERVLETLTVIEREVTNVEGKWFLARIFPYRTTEDVIAGVVITLVEITERKHAEDIRHWFSTIVESANDAIISYDMDGVIVSWNHGAERIFGYRADEAIGQTQDLLRPPEMREEARGMLEKLRRGEAIPQFDTVRLNKDGTQIDVILSAAAMKNESNAIVGFTVIVLDDSERRRAVEQLQQARDGLEVRVAERTSELSRRVAQLAQLSSDLTLIEQRERDRVARILHDEFQQLLVGAKMKLEECGDRLAEGDDQRGCDIARSRAVSLIDQALESSRSLAVELSPPILAEGLGKALEWLCGIWVKKTHSLKVKMDIDTSQDARTEEIRLLAFLAVRELLFNIVKHTEVREADVRLHVENGTLAISVEDRGQGFDPDLLHQGGGSGFGLAGLRERLELLGGGLDLSTRPGNGVIAVLRVPRKTSEEDETTETS